MSNPPIIEASPDGKADYSTKRYCRAKRSDRHLRISHRIVVAAPLHADALTRLSSLFTVAKAQDTSSLEVLESASGLMLSQNHAFPATRLHQLPRLQAIGLTGSGPGRIDLDAMTEAGIRVTHAPLDDTALIAGALWRSLERTLNHHALDQKERGDGINGPLRLRFTGHDALTDTLARRAREAGFSVERQRPGQSTPANAGDACFLVRVADGEYAQHAGPPHIIDLRDDRRALSHPGAIDALRDGLAVDGLIAAMGIGRDGFHPRFLLNPDVCPMSCC